MNDRSPRHEAVAGLLAAPFYLILLTALGALEPSFSHLTAPMSMLGSIPGVTFNFGIVVTGVLVTTFAFGLQRRLPPGWTAKLGVALLILGGLGLIRFGTRMPALYKIQQHNRPLMLAVEFVLTLDRPLAMTTEREDNK